MKIDIKALIVNGSPSVRELEYLEAIENHTTHRAAAKALGTVCTSGLASVNPRRSTAHVA